MLICGMEFDFSSLNADDVERMEAAQERQQAAAEAEQKRYEAENVPYTGILRSQCRLMMDYLDAVLGEGASARLGLSGNDFGAVLKACESFKQAMAEERAQLSALKPLPQNRAQRRAQRRAEARKVTAGQVKPPLVLPAAQAEALPDAMQPDAVKAQVDAELPGFLRFIATPEGAKLMHDFMTAYKGDANNG